MKNRFKCMLWFSYLTGLLSLTTMVHAQDSESNHTLWVKIDTLEKQGLISSAREIAETIYLKARKTNNEPEQIKALIYQLKYNETLEEDAAVKNIQKVAATAEEATLPAKAILESMQAELYWNYLRQNRYKLYSRTNLSQTAPAGPDISTWDARQLQAKITTLYLSSLQNDGLLKKTRLTAFAPVMLKGKNTQTLRPTLFDLLAHRALDYFKDGESMLMQPGNHIQINNPKAFAPVDIFINTSFVTHDSDALNSKAISLMQELLRFHTSDPEPGALLDADFERLEYMHQHVVSGSKDSLYENALRQLISQYADNAASAQASYLLAQFLYQRGAQYDATDNPAHRFDKRSAKSICENVIKKFPASEGGIHCKQLLLQIETPFISLKVEKVNVPGKPFRSLLSYKNIPKVYLRLVKLPESKVPDLSQSNDMEDIVRMPAYRQWEQAVPATGDYQEHAAEIKIAALPVGKYALIGSRNSSFSTTDNPLSVEYLSVSRISYMHDREGSYFVLDRETGHPLSGIRVQVWEYRFNTNTRKNELKKADHYTTNKNGYFKIDTSDKYRNFRLEFSGENDHLFANDYQNVIPYQRSEAVKEEGKTFLFTDRSIYRPGQQVFFKGILIETNSETHQNKILKDQSVTIFLYDAHGEKVDSVLLKTNSSGSCAGSFRLPSGGLNGQMSLRDTQHNGSVYFSVEAYKRPKFYIDFSKTDEAYRLDDSVKVKGLTKSYSGAPLGDVSVHYRVVRNARFPYPWLIRTRIGWPSSPQQEIATGTLQTDHQGKFTIPFKALPDQQVDTSLHPIFTYYVTAEVTDINGETQSGETFVAIGYQALELHINLKDKIQSDSLASLSISTTNLDETPVPSLINLQVYRLNSPDRLIRERYWQQPDQFVISQEEYLHDFPYDEYKNESDPATWKRTLVLSAQDSSTQDQWKLDSRKITPGWYAFTATTKDAFGETVTLTKYVQVYEMKMKKLPFKAALWAAPLSASAMPGQSVAYIAGTSERNAFIIRQEKRMNDEDAFSFPHLSEKNERMPVSVNEDDRGGILYHYFRILHNRFYQESVFINVPWDNKELKISYETFRDKMLPGSKEQWKLKISGPKGEQQSAELLASMYDASLDAFRPHNWPALNLYPALPQYSSWSANDNFSFIQGQNIYRSSSQSGLRYEKSYPSLNWFGYNPYAGTHFMLRGANTMAPAPQSSRLNEAVVVGYGTQKKKEITGSVVVQDSNASASAPTSPQVRENLNETAFFFPQLQTDSSGTVVLNFTMPEALTRWKFMAFAHTKDLAYASSEKEVITQKPLMVVPNPPRFLRQGDQVVFSTKIVSMKEQALSGQAELQLLDATTLQPVNNLFDNNTVNKPFETDAQGSTVVNWRFSVPAHFTGALLYRVTAQTGNMSDGEQAALPVLSNRVLVTETLPLHINGSGERTFKFNTLLQSTGSGTRSNYGLTVEYATNPSWYAVQALPSLTEGTNESAEQLFDKYYATALAASIASNTPQLRPMFEKWRSGDTAALLSNLQKNESLKNALLQETPWVLAAKTEAGQKQKIASLFDPATLKDKMTSHLRQLQQLQEPNGAFGWFKGMPDDRYITQSIITGLGRLIQLKAVTADAKPLLDKILNAALPYLDEKIEKDYAALLKQKTDPDKQHISPWQIQYLYMRSFFPTVKIPATAHKAVNYYTKQAAKYWLEQNKYFQGMIALAASRSGDIALAKKIIRSLHETAIRNAETGMYWKEVRAGYVWYQAPIETESLLIAAFRETGGYDADLAEMKTWLLKQKQTRNWHTSRATANAIYALLLTGDNWLAQQPEVSIEMGKESIQPTTGQQEAGTGYFQQFIKGTSVEPAMGNITLQVKGAKDSSPSWGGVYWQYFDDMDQVTADESSALHVSRSLYLERNTDHGPVLEPLQKGHTLKTGDRVKVRMTVKCDRDMDYVMLKDLRASCFEPGQVISGYTWQSGLGYYQVTDDVSTRFYIDHLRKGTYVIEYRLFAAQSGDFTNGVCTLQSMYAPEFSSHSNGFRIQVGN